MTQFAISFDSPRIDPSALARNTDPITSLIAADRAVEFAKGHRAAILAALEQHGPMDSESIGRLLGMDAYQVRKRLPELQRAGLAAPTEQTVPTASGRLQRVWRAA